MKNIKVYSTPTCPSCTTLKSFLDEKQIEYEDLNVGIDGEARERMIEKTEQISVPVIEINGKFIVGFNISVIKTILNIE